MKPIVTLKWVKNKRAGGGVVITCNWLLHLQKLRRRKLQESDQNNKCNLALMVFKT